MNCKSKLKEEYYHSTNIDRLCAIEKQIQIYRSKMIHKRKSKPTIRIKEEHLLCLSIWLSLLMCLNSFLLQNIAIQLKKKKEKKKTNNEELDWTHGPTQVTPNHCNCMIDFIYYPVHTSNIHIIKPILSTQTAKRMFSFFSHTQ